MAGEDAPKGATAVWPEFRTSLGAIKVIYKSNKGYVDLEFPKYGDKVADLLSVIKDRMSNSMQVWKTGKSASVRISNDNWILDFSQSFENTENISSFILHSKISHPENSLKYLTARDE